MTISKQGIAEAAVILMIATVLSRILGFVREMTIAYKFGATAQVDAYLVAFIVPGMLAAMVAGAITIVFIPIFTEYRVKENETVAWQFASNITNITLVALIAGSLVSLLGAPVLVPLIAPGLAEQTKETAVYLMQIMSPLVLLSGLLALSTAMINAYRHFIYPAFAALLYNICIISSILFLTGYLSITALALGVVVGTIIQLLAQSTVLIKKLEFYKFSFDLSHPGVKKAALLIVPIIIGSAAGQLNLIIDRMLASGLIEGSIAALHFATRVMGLPLGIFAAAVGVALYPTLSQQVAKGELNNLRATLSLGLRITWFIVIPASAGMIVLHEPLTRLLFERGAFDPTATQLTAIALLYYSLGIFAHAGLGVVVRVYFSMQDTITPVKVGVIAVVINIVLNLILVQYMAHAGLALATSIAAACNLMLLVIYLRKKLGQLDGKRILLSTVKIASASLVMIVACQLLLNWSYYYLGQSPALGYQLIQVGGIALTGTIIYFVMAVLLRMEELVRVSELKYFRKLGLEKIIKKLAASHK